MTESEIDVLVNAKLVEFCHELEDRIMAYMSAMVAGHIQQSPDLFQALSAIRHILADMAPPDDDE